MREPTYLEIEWAKFAVSLATATSEYSTGILQIRKFVQGYTWEVPADVWNSGFPTTGKEIGYRNDTSKIRQLERNYFNREELDNLRTKMLARIHAGKKQTAMTANVPAGAKDKRSSGHCIQTVTLTYFNGKLRVDFNYRVTEILKKFSADLIFLNTILVPYLLKDIPGELEYVSFYFSNIYFSAMFLPVVFRYFDSVDFLRQVRKADPKFYRICHYCVKRFIEKDKDHYGYKDRRLMHHLFLDLVAQGFIDQPQTVLALEEI